MAARTWTWSWETDGDPIHIFAEKELTWFLNQLTWGWKQQNIPHKIEVAEGRTVVATVWVVIDEIEYELKFSHDFTNKITWTAKMKSGNKVKEFDTLFFLRDEMDVNTWIQKQVF